jgi:hypothetical protein
MTNHENCISTKERIIKNKDGTIWILAIFEFYNIIYTPFEALDFTVSLN